MYLHFDVDENGQTRIDGSEHLSFDDSMRILGTGALALMQGLDKYIQEKDPEHYDEVHGHIYDTFNILAGNILDVFDSTRSPATDLTAEAILRAENEILDECEPDASDSPAE